MRVNIVLGSGSDLPVADKATKILQFFDVYHQVRIASAHRSAKHLEEVISDAEEKGALVHIAVAGLAAALPGAVAAMTTKPVIGVPVGGKVPFDSLLSIAQLPPGIPAACVGVDRGDNAALLAIQILATGDDDLAEKLLRHRIEATQKVIESDRELQHLRKSLSE